MLVGPVGFGIQADGAEFAADGGVESTGRDVVGVGFDLEFDTSVLGRPLFCGVDKFSADAATAVFQIDVQVPQAGQVVLVFEHVHVVGLAGTDGSTYANAGIDHIEDLPVLQVPPFPPEYAPLVLGIVVEPDGFGQILLHKR